MDREWKQALEEALEKIEAIGFFAAIGMHFAESTPLLSEDVGDKVKGTPWERFSSTDQCFKMIHQLATKAWHNLEGIAISPEAKIAGLGGLVGEKRDFVKEITEPEEAKTVTELPSYCQIIAGEIRLLKTMGESIVSWAGDEKQAKDLDHERVKGLGEMIINTADTIYESLQGQREKINKESFGGEGLEKRLGKPLELIGGELNGIKAFGASLVAMGMACPAGFKLNPREIKAIGQMIVELANKVTEKLSQADPPQLSLVSG